MGFFDFLKNRIKDKKQTKIKLEELNEYIFNKQKELTKEKQEFLKNIKNRINQLIQELKEHILILELIDLKEKKVEQRIKLIVKENLDNYIFHLKKLIENLDRLEFKDPEDILKKIEIIFSNFDKKSIMSFQKATFLIGKELEKVVRSIANFSKDFKNIRQNNSDLIKNNRIISSINHKLEEINEIKKLEKEIQAQINSIAEKIKELKAKNEYIEKEIQEIKKSKEYSKEISKKQDIEKKKQELKGKIYQLKEIIDFKTLTNIFHANEKEMEIIKEHKENFNEAFQKDNGEKIISLINDAKLSNDSISKKTEEINENKSQINNLEENIIEKKAAEIILKESEINKIKIEIEELNKEKNRQKKRNEKFNETKGNTINSIKEELSKIEVILDKIPY